LWRHKQRTPNTNDYPMPLNETPPWKVSAYATESSIVRQVDFDSVIRNFANKNARKSLI